MTDITEPDGGLAVVTTGNGPMLSQISTAIVRLHSEYYGKGPTKARTRLVDDMVVCVLREGFTRVEHTLMDHGRPDLVTSVRHAFQVAMRDQFVSVVETATSRKVVAFLSQVHLEPDISVEMFFLEPIGNGEPAVATDGSDPVTT